MTSNVPNFNGNKHFMTACSAVQSKKQTATFLATVPGFRKSSLPFASVSSHPWAHSSLSVLTTHFIKQTWGYANVLTLVLCLFIFSDMENEQLHELPGEGQLLHTSDKRHSLSPSRKPFANRERDRDSVARDKERLLRFHREAKSFLTKAYSNDDDVLVEDRFDHVPTAGDSADDFLAKRRIEMDKIRLERFHAQAVSFLNRAYNDEPDTLVVEESLSPDRTAALQDERAMLQSFHKEAMSFLDAAAVRAPVTEGERGVHQKGRISATDETEHSSRKIERDKARLEQNYLDVMSFLKRADENGKEALVEEQELEPHMLERMQLQKYAKDAMSFLDKAFRNEASVMIGDEEETSSPSSKTTAEGTGQDQDILLHEAKSQEKRKRPSAQVRHSSASRDVPWHAEEDRQIAEDRAALERYDEEFGDFLSKAYLDDSTVIVDDGDSDTAPTEQSDGVDHIVPGAISVSSPSPPPEDFISELHFRTRSPSLPEHRQAQSQASPFSRRSPLQDPNSVSRKEVDGAVQTNSSFDPTTGEIRRKRSVNMQYPRFSPTSSSNRPQHKPPDGKQSGLWRNRPESAMRDGRENYDRVVQYNSQLAADEGAAASKPDLNRKAVPTEGVTSDFLKQESNASPTPEGASPLVYFALDEDNNPRQGWSEMPLEKSFYSRLPRGSTIKLRPRATENTSSSNRSENTRNVSHGINQILLNDLRRVEKERDALISALEEILNERSMLAQQLSEMRTTALGKRRGRGAGSNIAVDGGEIDLAAELRDANETMAKLTEEMELTLRVLDARYHETLHRAEKAEDRCAHLQAEASQVERELSSERKLATKTLSEQNRLLLLVRELEQEAAIHKEAAASKDRDRAELARLEASVRKLTTENADREKHLKWQLGTLRSKAEEAESAAARAEQDAIEATEVAKIAVERSQKMFESERKARQYAEADKQTVVMESKAWEKFARQRMEINASGAGEDEDLESSRAALGSDGSASKHGSKENPKKKRDGARGSRGGAADRTNSPSLLEEMKKKSLSRLFR
ncbi:unnamed protein product [Chondrus crispus]|uniref:Uncharacterized protein n=1 Tax=Chondrus crispus TaxID=2769 RepID=R7QGH6_CHOCR|nr:unnamed protein product [Chondrus crispus]CDF36495.1 unnamed protein product [Chondrus crispus]|eukprot:XP_005716314.1 unnamed protein product [Chondrus crispus]